MDKKQQTFGKYRLGKTLGKGYQAKVKVCFAPNSNKSFAVKIFKRIHSEEKNTKALIQEAGHLTQLKHENLVNLVEILKKEQYVKKNGETYTTMGIVLEYCTKGELFDYLLHSGKFTEEQSRYYFKQLISGLQYLHTNNVCHRDLKPENILLDENFVLKIADFGFSARLDGKDGSGFLKSSLGTEGYMAPEINEKKAYIGSAVDLFAAGIILFIMYTGHPPFHKALDSDPYYKLLITDRNSTFWEAHSRNKEKGFFSNDFMNLMNSILAYDPQNRIDLAELIVHPWMKHGKTSSAAEIKNLFSNRHKQVVEKMEEEKKKKQAEKLKEKEKEKDQDISIETNDNDSSNKDKLKGGNNVIYAAKNKFRSGESTNQAEIEMIVEKFNLKNPREIESYNEEEDFKQNDIFLSQTPDEILLTLLQHQNEFSQTVNVSKDQYKIKCTKTDENGELIEFSIQLKVNKDSNISVITFNKKQGDYYQFLQVVNHVHKFFEV